jgi:hypothetical protein
MAPLLVIGTGELESNSRVGAFVLGEGYCQAPPTVPPNPEPAQAAEEESYWFETTVTFDPPVVSVVAESRLKT